MLSKNEVKYIQSLCHKKQRDEDGVFIAEGPKLVEELLLSHWVVRKVYAVEEWVAPKENKAQVVRVTESELERISGLQTAHQVLAIAEQEPDQQPVLGKGAWMLALDGIQDPGNLGTLIRIADWFGIAGIIAGKDTVDRYNPKVVQSTMGSFLRVSVYYASLPEVLADCPVPVYGALLDGENVYTVQHPEPGVLVIGNESKGIRESVLPLITHAVTIPRMGLAESLNAAVATGILASHLMKP